VLKLSRKLDECEPLGAGKWTDAVGVAAGGGIGIGIGDAEAAGNDGVCAKSVQATAVDQERMNNMKAFWLPSKTPNESRRAEKPDGDTKCPTTLKKLRMKAGAYTLSPFSST